MATLARPAAPCHAGNPAAAWPAWTDAYRYEQGPACPTARELAARHAVGAVAETTAGVFYIDGEGVAYLQPHPTGREEDDLPDRVRVGEMVWDYDERRWIAEPRHEGQDLDMDTWGVVLDVARDWASNL